MRLAGVQLEKEYEREVKIIQSDPLFDCIAHHTYEEIPEDGLTKKIYECKIGSSVSPPPVIGPGAYIKYLVNEGILRRVMAVGDDRWHYRLSPVGKYVVDKMIKESREKFKHPPLQHG